MDEPDHLLCVGGPWAGKRVAVQPGQRFVELVRPVSFLSDRPWDLPDVSMRYQTVLYEKVPLADRNPRTGDADYIFVLAYKDRTVPVLRELLNGYERSFE